MKDWIKEYFSNTAFNPYKRQMIPCTEGLHLKMYSYVAIHKQVAVPLHFREAVWAGIKVNVRKGLFSSKGEGGSFGKGDVMSNIQNHGL